MIEHNLTSAPIIGPILQNTTWQTFICWGKKICVIFHPSVHLHPCSLFTFVLPVLLHFRYYCITMTQQSKIRPLTLQLYFLFYSSTISSHHFFLHMSHYAFQQNYSVILFILESPWDGLQRSQSAVRIKESYLFWILERGKKKSNQRKRSNLFQWGDAGIQSALCMESNLLSCLVWGIGSWQLSDNAQNFTCVFHLILWALMPFQLPQRFRSSLCFIIHFRNYFVISWLCFIGCCSVVFFLKNWIW